MILCDDTFLYVKPCPDDKHRLYTLQDGDIITVFGLTLEHVDGLFFEVEETYGYGFAIYNPSVQTIWARTGKAFTPEDINKMAKMK